MSFDGYAVDDEGYVKVQFVYENIDPFILNYERDGIVIIRNVISQDMVKESVQDIWETIVSLPWKKEYRDRWEKLHTKFKDNYWKDVKKDEVEEGREIYPSMGKFGALNPPPFYNLKTQWKIRQDPSIVDIFSKILKEKDLMVSLDRVSFKFPGQGENEFMHWDSNPYLWPEEKYKGVQGIVALSDTSFFAVPGTHTEDFRKKFIKEYPWNNRRDQYLIDKNHDPFGLLTKGVEYKLNKGDLVVWSNRLLHEARINKKSTVRYAYYLTYFPHGHPPEEVIRTCTNAGINYLDDRIESYTTGKNPTTYPSGTKIELFPKMVWMYYPDKIMEFSNKFTKVASEEKEYQSGKKKGQKVRIPINYSPLELGIYTPPEFTVLGKKLLGLPNV